MDHNARLSFEILGPPCLLPKLGVPWGWSLTRRISERDQSRWNSTWEDVECTWNVSQNHWSLFWTWSSWGERTPGRPRLDRSRCFCSYNLCYRMRPWFELVAGRSHRCATWCWCMNKSPLKDVVRTWLYMHGRGIPQTIDGNSLSPRQTCRSTDQRRHEAEV